MSLSKKKVEQLKKQNSTLQTKNNLKKQESDNLAQQNNQLQRQLIRTNVNQAQPQPIARQLLPTTRMENTDALIKTIAYRMTDQNNSEKGKPIPHYNGHHNDQSINPWIGEAEKTFNDKRKLNN